MTIAFRVDASQAIGTGHLMRCLTLADALMRAGENCVFLCRHIPESLAALLAEKGHRLLRLNDAETATNSPLAHAAWLGRPQEDDAAECLALLESIRPAWLVADHYALDSLWENTMRRAATRILAIDDIADRQHASDLLLDQNLYHNMQTRYNGKLPAECSALLGPRYALLREEFRQLRQNLPPKGDTVERVLIFFGGADADNITEQAMQALLENGFRGHVDVVTGAQHPAKASIAATCQAQGWTHHIQTPHLAALMAQAQLAIGAGGSATWERACLGLPCITLCIAENQRQLVTDAAKAGIIHASDSAHLTEHIALLLKDAMLRHAISEKAMSLVDGRGTARVLLAMGYSPVTMRLANEEDSAALFNWRNDARIRAVSRSSAPIEPAGHEAWLHSVLQDKNRLLLIGEEGGTPVGVVRFDVAEHMAEVSIYLVPDVTGKGHALLLSAENWLRRHHPHIQQLNAEVLADNIPSHRLFQRAGYTQLHTQYTKKVTPL